MQSAEAPDKSKTFSFFLKSKLCRKESERKTIPTLDTRFVQNHRGKIGRLQTVEPKVTELRSNLACAKQDMPMQFVKKTPLLVETEKEN